MSLSFQWTRTENWFKMVKYQLFILLLSNAARAISLLEQHVARAISLLEQLSKMPKDTCLDLFTLCTNVTFTSKNDRLGTKVSNKQLMRSIAIYISLVCKKSVWFDRELICTESIPMGAWGFCKSPLCKHEFCLSPVAYMLAEWAFAKRPRHPC